MRRRHQRQAEQFRKVYEPMFRPAWRLAKSQPTVRLAPMSTYIRASYWKARSRERTMKACARSRCSATTSPPTTPHPMHPSRQRRRRVPGEMGLPEEDFNSYAPTVATSHCPACNFANPTLKNEMGWSTAS